MVKITRIKPGILHKYLLMLSFLTIVTLAQVTPIPMPSPTPQEILQPQEVRSLPGNLDRVPMFNSNSPEVVQTEGILLSTFPPTGKAVPTAHLNFPFEGRFDVFAHHINKARSPEDLRSLYLGIILYNPGSAPVTVDIFQAASYLSVPDAPFIDLPPEVENDLGTVYAGPGDRVMNDILRGQHQSIFPPLLVIPGGESRIVLNAPIPVQGLTQLLLNLGIPVPESVPPINGRSTLMRLRSDGKVYMASLAMFAKQNPDGSERAPTLPEWQTLLETGNLAGPRDRSATPPEQTSGSIIYGRVAGVATGSKWQARLIDRPLAYELSIPKPGVTFSYALSTVTQGTLGTRQIQSADMLVRYPDTAYRAHGNYGVEYSLSLPLYNNTGAAQTVTISMQTPLKEDNIKGGLRFLQPPGNQVFFRGTVQIGYKDDRGLPRTGFVHLVQRRGQQGEPLVTLNMPPGDRRLVEVDFLYPPDATPPQVLTVSTTEKPGFSLKPGF